MDTFRKDSSMRWAFLSLAALVAAVTITLFQGLAAR